MFNREKIIEGKTIKEWHKLCTNNISFSNLYYRLGAGMSIHDAITLKSRNVRGQTFEGKTVKEWHELCTNGISVEGLGTRLRRGMKPKDAIVAVTRGNDSIVRRDMTSFEIRDKVEKTVKRLLKMERYRLRNDG